VTVFASAGFALDRTACIDDAATMNSGTTSDPSSSPRNTSLVVMLGTSQTLAWASSYYLPAVLATSMARDLGTTTVTVFAAFSLALLVSAAVGPLAGRLIDNWGGRPVLMCSSLVFAAGLSIVGLAGEPVMLFVGWAVIGLAMGSGLYEAAFSTLVRLRGTGARTAITGITLIAGFASTVGWPLSALLEAQIGWRGACLTWAALHLLLGLPLNAALPRVVSGTSSRKPPPTSGAHPAQQSGVGTGLPETADRTLAVEPAEPCLTGRDARVAGLLLAFVFAVTWFISTAMAAHLPMLLQGAGVSIALAVGLGALVGPAQVAARLLEFGLLRRTHPLLSARLAAVAHPVGAVLLLAWGPALAPLFVLLHGAGNGILTIAKGTLPLVLFGPQGYGARQGWLSAPGMVLQALAPWLFGLALAHSAAAALLLSTSLTLAALAGLLLLRVPPR
jgi:MFS family permease